MESDSLIGQDLLLSLAQVGLAFSGISSLLTIFQKRDREWEARDVAGMKFMLENNIGLLLSSLLPFLCFYLSESIDPVSRWIFGYGLLDAQRAAVSLPSLALGGFLVWQTVKNYQRRVVLIGKNQPPTYDWRLLFFVLPITGMLAILLLVSGWVGLSGDFSRLFGFYVLGLSWQLTMAVIQFAVFVIVLTKGDSTDLTSPPTSPPSDNWSY